MKNRKILAALCASAIAISAMAVQVSAESTGTAAAETTAESSEQAAVFNRGVWKFTSEKGTVTYYIFEDEKSGHTERDDGTGGVPFACEQDGWNITFHFGGPDDTTKAAVSEGDASVTFTYEDGNTQTYSVEYVDGADPDTFSADEYENTTTHVFSKGVWLFSDDDTTGTYFIFDDETSGHTERADNTGGVPFSCEQDGWNITFHFGGPDDTTKAAVSEGDAIVTFTYEDGTTKTYTVSYIDGADPDTFDTAEFDLARPEILVFGPGVWMYTIYPVDGYTVTDPQGYFRINEDGESGEWVDKAGFASKFEIDQSDLSDIRIKVDGEELDGMIQIEYESIDAIAAYISIAGNTMLYTFNHVPEDEEDAFIESFGSSSNGVVDAADSKGSPDTGVADVAAAAGLGILAAGAFAIARKRK